MLDELLKSTPGAPAAPGVDPLSAILSTEVPAGAPVEPRTQEVPVANAVPDAVPGSA